MSFQKYRVDQKINFQSDVPLNGILSMPTGKKTDRSIILCHGITCDKDELGRFVELTELLIKQGFTVFRFDFRGHGESAVKQEDMTISGALKDLEAAFSFMGQQGFGKIDLLGASFGGGIAALFAAKNNDRILHLVLWNPVLNYDHNFFHPTNPLIQWTKKLFSEENMNSLKKDGYIILGRRKFHMGKQLIDEMSELKPYEVIRTISCPVLFLQGIQDTHVDYRDSIEYGKITNGESKVILYKDFDHGFHNKNESSVAYSDTIHFLTQ